MLPNKPLHTEPWTAPSAEIKIVRRGPMNGGVRRGNTPEHKIGYQSQFHGVTRKELTTKAMRFAVIRKELTTKMARRDSERTNDESHEVRRDSERINSESRCDGTRNECAARGFAP